MSKVNQKINHWLPLKKFHILPIIGLSPDEIKYSAKNVHKDREKISHTTLLNACVKALGFSGGFAEYQRSHYQKLRQFMKENQLIKHSDLVTISDNHLIDPLTSLQKISERLFYSNKALPEKIFTGYDFPYKTYSDIFNLHFDKGICEIKTDLEIDSKQKDDWFLFNDDNILIDTINKIKDAPNSKIVFDYSEQFNRYHIDTSFLKGHSYGINKSNPIHTEKLIDYVLGYLTSILYAYNLIDDQFVYPQLDKNYIYTRGGFSSIDKYTRALNFFTLNSLALDKGWIEIIPYNDNLIFLKGKNGEYNFVFKNQRDKKFEHCSYYQPFLKISDVPKFEDEYHFKRWYYFEYQGFREKLIHQADVGHCPRYEDEIKEYCIREKVYKPLISCKSKRCINGFELIELPSGKKLMVSQLVSVEDFQKFYQANTEYFQNREKYSKQSNTEIEKLFHFFKGPISCNLPDVMKYTKWFNEKNDIEVRLLNTDEYKLISPFENEKNKQETTIVTKNNLDFINSDSFYEFLCKNMVISSRSNQECSGTISQRQPNELAPIVAYPSGIYMKYGFRLCYEYEGDE
ncbi:hypothetical protein QJU89_04370 [Pasteurella skyensis]|uniref:Uncharacterized protein n=1 Tax=Phocoenobacter skyensis TaxID=97481 RepID=A0AAJ6N8M3_9PAST|nr:hypothetical protein [Pasteurella skyensis]MDP8162070.1 hypothetical protein [Pasteurella skyensis]MDP8172226.1 hypothetical protein [Pasteurella skyensis]MDP8176425.1 hypothetical protein [Pasteurella skyensis]MDP8178314.1 hypothetical protein [Pasteurella skyensis]MDP8182930.1 hypothetical protein [Pasteurella skyensis]